MKSRAVYTNNERVIMRDHVGEQRREHTLQRAQRWSRKLGTGRRETLCVLVCGVHVC